MPSLDTPGQTPSVPKATRPLAERWRTSQAAQIATFVLLDLIIVWVSTILAYFVRFEGAIPFDFVGLIMPIAIGASILFPLLFLAFGLYGYIWRYVGVPALVRLAWVTLTGMGMLLIADILLSAPPLGRPIPYGTLAILGVLLFMGFFGVRAFSRLLAYVQRSPAAATGRRVLVIGAGSAGALLLHDIEEHPSLGLRVVGLVDDDPAKQGRRLRNTRVVGVVAELPSLVVEYDADELFVAMPGAPSEEMRRVLYAAGQTRLPVKLIPGLAAGNRGVGFADLQNADFEDFLGRPPVVTDLRAIRRSIEGRRVMVTGAAGTIGSEICRQVVRMNPSKLIMVEMDESRLYETYLDVRELDPSAAWMSLTDIRDPLKLGRVFQEHRPDMVIHAAAYKHVPLMEYEPEEAIKANILGTLNVLDACTQGSVKDFVLVSTDKAVAPSSVMGATKRAAELLSLASARRGLQVTVVRFGNVLGSRGSVMPIVDHAIRSGTPVRVTHPEVTRYFMSVAEAVQLVLQAHALTDGCDLFVLEMGDPVAVMDMLQHLVEFRGGQADIVFSGLRPAEKLHETLVSAGEELLPTKCDKVLRLDALPIVSPDVHRVAASLSDAIAAGASGTAAKRLVGSLVAEYVPSEDGQPASEPQS